MNGTFSLMLKWCSDKALLLKSSYTTVTRLTEQGLICPLTSLQCGTVLQSLTNTKSYGKCLQLHAHMITCGTLVHNTYLNTKIAACYAGCGRMAEAQGILCFQCIPNLGYVKNGKARDAFIIFDHMKNAGFRGDETTLLALLSGCGDLTNLKVGKAIHGYVVRNSGKLCSKFLTNSLIDMYSNCDSISDARKLFEKLKMKDIISWNSLISGYERHGDVFETLQLFCQMIMENEVPDEATVISMLGACNQISALQLGSSIHSYIVKNGFGANTAVGTALLDMYTKCGSLPSARRAFDEMPERNLASWTVIVTGFGIHGRGKEAISMFYEMLGKNIIPDEGMFTSVLSACSHSGLVDEGKEIFYKMMREYNVEPKATHYACLVDLLGRAGNLDEAYAIINDMKVKPNYDIWNSLLSACRLYHNVKLAEISAHKLFEMNPKGVSSYVCLSNIYAAERRWSDVEKVRALVRRKRLRKPPGYSLVELNNMVHQFFAGDKSHQQSEDIYTKLKDLNGQLKNVGYKPDTDSVLHDVEEEVKEKMLWDHSERLALAFALINTDPSTTIRITKNLRVCGDCHTVMKMVSKLMSREIIMRDIRRFHHFRDGACSCSDYW
ncbi:pentatricopeptide repeat-containing protein At4g21065-like isoform X2 [Neltuma alba]|uniref:pentatricopeptide repeat-containing protein At4g21065-like isoform X2 n=1 Tax=Neltuma alba TaxID=207710 RepID=UPI0010A3B1C9|nr:pentatricopeptide repeat-containing protein At4g21065-like isoform X2 [Prosopis alba]